MRNLNCVTNNINKLNNSDLEEIFYVPTFSNLNYWMQSSEKIEISTSDIVTILIDKDKAKQKLTDEIYYQFIALYNKKELCGEKRELDYNTFIEVARKIIDEFNQIAPYEKFINKKTTQIEYVAKVIIYGKNKFRSIIFFVLLTFISMGGGFLWATIFSRMAKKELDKRINYKSKKKQIFLIYLKYTAIHILVTIIATLIMIYLEYYLFNYL